MSANASKCEVACRYCRQAIVDGSDVNRQCRICPTCDELMRAKQGASRHITVDRARRRTYAAAMRRRIERAIPDVFRQARWGQLANRLRAVLASRRPGQGILLWGPAGSGKSHALAALARHTIIATIATRGEIRVERVAFEGLTLAIRSCYGSESSRSEEDILRPLIESDLLVIEDLGTSASSGAVATDFRLQKIVHLIDTRMEHCRPTFITSNLSVESLERMFDERLASRLHTFKVIELAGRDRRRQK